jgi:hypothetical protein
MREKRFGYIFNFFWFFVLGQTGFNNFKEDKRVSIPSN